MNYNDTQFAELSRFEDNFRTATSTPTGWTRRIAIPDQRRIKAIYTEATGERIPFNVGCGNCLLNLLRRAGRLWFADKEEREQAAKNVAEAAQTATESPEITDAKPADKPKRTRKPKAEKNEK